MESTTNDKYKEVDESLLSLERGWCFLVSPCTEQGGVNRRKAREQQELAVGKIRRYKFYHDRLSDDGEG